MTSERTRRSSAPSRAENRMSSRASERRRVLVVGGNADNGGTLAGAVTKGFAQAGCDSEMVPFENWRPRRRFVSTMRGLGTVGRLVDALALPALEARLVAHARSVRPDVVVIIKTDELHRATYAALRLLGSKVVAFHPDDPFAVRTLLRPGPAHRRSLVQMREADLYVAWAPQLAERAARHARACVYLPFATDPPPDVPGVVPLRADVGFLGNWDEERERWLASLAEAGLTPEIWGAGYWSTRCSTPALRAAWRGRPLFGDDVTRAMRATRINLNVLRHQNKDACNMRTFEIPAARGFMLHERSRALPDLFRPGVECDDFGDTTELVAKVRYYLEHDAERRAIAEAGHRAALRQTYRHWAERVLAALAPAQRTMM